MAIAQSLAATSKADFATYNYIALEQAANQAAEGPDIVYVIIHDKEGRVAGYNGRPDLQSTRPSDGVGLRAIAAMHPLVQQTIWGPDKIPVLDVAVPVLLPGSAYRWGTIRIALSLQPMYHQIRQGRMIIAAIGMVALALSILVAVWAAQRVTRPLGYLVDATVEVALGSLDHEIPVNTGDEVEVLAHNFSLMVKEIVSQRQQMELQMTEIKRLQRYTEKLLITMNDGLLSIDREGNVATINPAAHRMLKPAREDPKGAPVADFLGDVPAMLNHIREMFEDPGRSSQLEIHLGRDDNPRILLAGSSVLADAEGNPAEVIVNLHDITDLKNLEARVRQTERLAALGTLAAGMAHEIRNPLSAVKTFAQLLPRKIEKPGFLEKFQRTVPRELERINRLVEDLLELARHPRYHLRASCLRSLLEQSAELFEEELRVKHIRYHADIPTGLPPIWADADQFTKALHNLFRNAIQAMPSGGELSIEAHTVEEDPISGWLSSDRRVWTCVAFKDTGMGISPEHIKSIFNPFFSTKDKGTGLGLAITHKVITEHNGRIEVASCQGKGTAFMVYLPVVEHPSPIPAG